MNIEKIKNKLVELRNHLHLTLQDYKCYTWLDWSIDCLNSEKIKDAYEMLDAILIGVYQNKYTDIDSKSVVTIEYYKRKLETL